MTASTRPQLDRDQLRLWLIIELVEAVPDLDMGDDRLTDGCSLESVGVDEVALAEVAGAIKEEFGIPVDVERLAELRTIGNVADYLLVNQR